MNKSLVFMLSMLIAAPHTALARKPSWPPASWSSCTAGPGETSKTKAENTLLAEVWALEKDALSATAIDAANAYLATMKNRDSSIKELFVESMDLSTPPAYTGDTLRLPGANAVWSTKIKLSYQFKGRTLGISWAKTTNSWITVNMRMALDRTKKYSSSGQQISISYSKPRVVFADRSVYNSNEFGKPLALIINLYLTVQDLGGQTAKQINSMLRNNPGLTVAVDTPLSQMSLRPKIRSIGAPNDGWPSAEYSITTPSAGALFNPYGCSPFMFEVGDAQNCPKTGFVHEGTDYLGDNLEVKAADRGIAYTFADQGGAGYGNHIIVINQDWVMVYAHLKRIDVANGASVQQGQVIARSGNTGLMGAPAHLHFETRRRSSLDPVYVPSDASCISSYITPDTTAPTAPGAPVAYNANTGIFTVTWTPASDASGISAYELQRNCSNKTCAEMVVRTTFPSYQESGLAAGSYWYNIRAIDGAGNAGPWSGGTITVLSPPTLPGALTARAVGSSQVDLSWGASTDISGIAYYDIFRRVQVCRRFLGSRYCYLRQDAFFKSPATSYQDKSVTTGINYFYWVQAVNNVGITGPSRGPVNAVPGSGASNTMSLAEKIQSTSAPDDIFSASQKTALKVQNLMAAGDGFGPPPGMATAAVTSTAPSQTPAHADTLILDYNGAGENTGVYAWNSDLNSWAQVNAEKNAASKQFLIKDADLSASYQVLAPSTPEAIAVASDLSQIKVFPNPLVVGGGAQDASAITFSGMPNQGRVQILSVNGEQVADLSKNNDGSGLLAWDTKNSRGSRVASGVYIYLITTPQGEHKKGRIAVVR